MLMDQTGSKNERSIDRLRLGDARALADLFDHHRGKLRRMVEIRMDPRLRARVDASDVLQEAFVDVARDLPAYLADAKLSPLLWLRLHVGRRLTTLHRRHLGTHMRDAGREISLYRDALPEASSAALASMLLGRLTSPTQAAQRAERLLRIQEAINRQRDATANNLRLANRNLIQAYTNEARAERRSRPFGHRFGTLAAIEKAMALAPHVGLSSEDRLALRNQAIAALALPDFRRGRSISVTDPLKRGFTIDADWQRYAVQEDDEAIRIRRLADDQELMSLPGLPLLESHRLMRFSPDGRYLAVAPMSAEQPLRVFDLSTGGLLLEGPSYYASNTRAWDFHPASHEIAVARRDRTVAIYSLPEGTLDRQLDFNAAKANNIHNLLYDPLGARIALSYQGPDGVAILDAATGQRLADRKIASYFFHIAWNPRRPDLLAIPIVNSHIEVWNVTTDRVMARCAPIGDGIIIAFHPSGDWLWSRGWNGQLRLWDARTGELELDCTTSSWYPDFHVARDGRRIGVETDLQSVRPIEFAGGDIHDRLVSESFNAADTYGALAVDPTGRHFVTLGSGGTQIWDASSGTQRGVIPAGSPSYWVQVDRDGSILTDLPYLIRWPVTALANGETRIGPPDLLHWFGTPNGFEIARESRRAVLAASNFGALVIDLDHPTRRRFLGPQPDVRAVAITPDGEYVATCTHGRRGSLKLWDSDTGEEQHAVGLDERTGDGVSLVSPDGRWLVVGEEGLVFLRHAHLDAIAPNPVGLLRGPRVFLGLAHLRLRGRNGRDPAGGSRYGP